MCPAGPDQARLTYEVAHTADLPVATLAEVRALLDAAFGEGLTDDDWEHALGGMHVIARAGTDLVGHASVVQRRLVTGGRAMRAGYVEAVGVHPDRWRQGVGAGMMDRIERMVRAAYDIGALGSSDEGQPLYRGRGWVPWRGPLTALTPDGIVPTDDEAGAVLVLVEQPIDLDAPLMCDWRDGDVW
jgi:aminoglycoside 2'-N-acetyltransferase I